MKDGQVSMDMGVRGKKSEEWEGGQQVCSAHSQSCALPGVYTGHMGGGVEYDTERSAGDRLNAIVRNLQFPWRALSLSEGL